MSDNISKYDDYMDFVSNITDEEDDNFYSKEEKFIVPVICLIIFVVGILANGTIIFIFWKHKILRTLPNIYFFSLVLADLLIIIACLPFMSIIYTLESWPWGDTICKMSRTTETISTGVTAFTLMALSAERFYIFIRPMSPGGKYIKPKTVVVSIWILATCFALQDAISSGLHVISFEGYPTIELCILNSPDSPGIDWKYMEYYPGFKFLIYCVIPLCTIIYFCVQIAVRLYGSDFESRHGQFQTKIYRNVTRTIFILVFIYFICFLSTHIFKMWVPFNPSSFEEYNEVWHFISKTAFCLSYFQYCLSPMALLYFNDVLKAHFRNCFCRRSQEGQEDIQLREEIQTLT